MYSGSFSVQSLSLW